MIQLEKYLSGQFQKSHTGYEFFIPTKVNDVWLLRTPNRVLIPPWRPECKS